MKSVSIGITILLLTILKINCQDNISRKILSPRDLGYYRCQKSKSHVQLCFCGKNKVVFNPLTGNKCVDGQIVRKSNQNSNKSKIPGLRLVNKALHISTRDDSKQAPCATLKYKQSSNIKQQAFVPLHNISVEAWIDSFAADVTITQIYVNQEQNPIEAIYVFPIEENAAIYSFTAEIDDRIIKAHVEEKQRAILEYQSAIQQGQTAVLMEQSNETLDIFTVNVGALPPGKQCRITIKYVTELDMIDGKSIRFVVPTTIAPRYNPSSKPIQSFDQTNTEYVQNTSYSISFNAHVLRGEQIEVTHVANQSHPVNVSFSRQSIDVSLTNIALDRDIILDVDLPENLPATSVSIEQSDDASEHAIMFAFVPSFTDFQEITNGTEEANAEYFFIVDCSGSMIVENRISLAREAMSLFVRSLPESSHFNIIRFGRRYDVLFKNQSLTAVLNEDTTKEALSFTDRMTANMGGTELLKPLQYLKDHPPVEGRSRQIFLLTDGEVSNTNQVIDLCRSMASTTRIFSFGLGHSPSRSLVKGLARATNGYFVFVPPNAKVDTYVGSQLDRALQPSIVNARLEWHGLSTNGSQAPKTIPPLYIGGRVLVYEIFKDEDLKSGDVFVDMIVDGKKFSSPNIHHHIIQKKDTIRRLAAKALIQELQHGEQNIRSERDNSTVREQIIDLSLTHQILSPYTAFVGIETISSYTDSNNSDVRHIPIEISVDGKRVSSLQPSYVSQGGLSGFGPGNSGAFTPIPLPMVMPVNTPAALSQSFLFDFGRSHHYRDHPPPQMLGAPSSLSSTPYWQGYAAMKESTTLPPPPSRWWYPGMTAALSFYVPTTTTSTTTTEPLLSTDPVRWLINQQSFNGVWKLNEKDIEKLTKGKSLKVFHSTITSNKDALTTALAIAILESKYADQKNLWNAIVVKGRKQLNNLDLSNRKIDLLLNEIKNKL